LDRLEGRGCILATVVTLSVCVFSNESPERLAAVVAPLRDVADDVVVVLDDRARTPDLTPLREVADSAFLAPFSGSFESNLEWLHAQCAGDWVLRLDGDEAPSRALIDRLAEDEWHRGVTHCSVPRRWLVDDGASWIQVNPWWPDLQMRLVKNEPGLLRFPDRLHELIEVAGPRRVLDAPIYHVDLVDKDLEVREAKVRRYHRQRPNLRTFGGLAQNAYYTPELVTPAPPVVPVPPEDRALVRALVDEDHLIAGGGRSRRPKALVDGSHTLPAEVSVQHVDKRGFAGRGLEFLVTVANTGTDPLDPASEHPFRIGCRWQDSEGVFAPEEGRGDLPRPLEAGVTETVLVSARIPAAAGEYTLTIGAVEELKQWLPGGVERRFTALDQPHVTLVGGYSPFRHLGDDLIMRALIEDLTAALPQLKLTLLADDPGVITDRFDVAAVHNAVRIHHANRARGRNGLKSVEWAMSDTQRGRGEYAAVDDRVANLADVLQQSDAFVIAAAGSLAGAYADDILWPRLIEAEIAAAAGVPVLITSAGIGPFTSDEHRIGARRLLDLADGIDARDGCSQRAVAELGSDSWTQVVPDAASAIASAEPGHVREFLSGIGMSAGRPYLVASVRTDDDAGAIDRVARSIEVAARRLGATALLVPHCASRWVDDGPALTNLACRLADDVDAVVLADIPPDPLAADLIRNAAVSIGSRFHNAVLSASAGKPAILFWATEYDERRARGLAAMPGTAVKAVSTSDESAVEEVGDILERPAASVRAPSPHPIVGWLESLDIVR
jgi:polysaccharide pyruvyl transferase WcaK-like protein